MKFGGILSAVWVAPTYAMCSACGVVYQDDIPVSGSVPCPQCKKALVRGISRNDARASLDDSQKELLS